MAIVNQTLMAELAVEYNLGADILSKGNRKVEKLLSADKMSGDTVNVPIMDSGIVYDNLDISALKGKLRVRRGSVPVTVRPIGTAAEATAEELTLCIQRPDLMKKRVANLQDETNTRAFRALLAPSQAFVATAGQTGDAQDRAYRNACYDAEASTTSSKYGGATYGIVHPQTWNRLVPSLQKDYGPNSSRGNKLYQNELGDFLGFRWTKSMQTGVITGVEQNFLAFDIGANGKPINPIGQASATETEIGALSQPVVLALADGEGNVIEYVKNVDALGKPTGIKKTVHFIFKGTHWELATPLFFEGPRKNCHLNAYHPYVPTTEDASAGQTYDTEDLRNGNYALVAGSSYVHLVALDVLTKDKTYLQPAVMWKEPDFLVAVKGIVKQAGPESYTIPTEFSEKGILPLRGSMFTDPWTDMTLFRADAMMGFGVYQGVSVSSIYLPLD